jgi:hypothetical protein
MFLSGLKDVVEVGPLALSHHVNFYAYETFVEIWKGNVPLGHF